MTKPFNILNYKRLIGLLSVFLFINCSSTKLISSWKNPDYAIFNPEKILVIGVTPNYEARKVFEFKVKTELNARKINALQSAVVFESSFQDKEQTEKEIELEVDKLLANNYDTILVALVKGVEENELHGGDSSKTDYHFRRFALYYLTNQDTYFNQKSNRKYLVYNIQASIYNLKKNSDKSLVWQASFDLVDPNRNSRAIKSFVNKLIKTLENEKIISN